MGVTARKEQPNSGTAPLQNPRSKGAAPSGNIKTRMLLGVRHPPSYPELRVTGKAGVYNARPMWIHHLVHLLGRAWHSSVNSLGNTTLTVVFAAAVFLAIQILKTIRKRGNVREFWRTHWRENIRDGTIVTACAWFILFSYNVGETIYQDHLDLVAANAVLLTKNKQLTTPVTSTSSGNEQDSLAKKTARKNNSAQNQTGKDNSQTGPIKQGDCGVVQNGGNNNTASPNCGPPPLVLTVASVISGLAGTVFTAKPGFVKTEITIIPNQQVTAPFTIVLDFDNPISEIGNTVKNVGAQMGGGPFTVGTHARDSVGTSIGPSHPLVVVVFSLLPVELMSAPRIEF